MANSSCFIGGNDFAEKVVERLNKEGKTEKYGISLDANSREGSMALQAISTFAEIIINGHVPSEKRKKLIEDIDGFIEDFEDVHMKCEIPTKDFNNAEDQYNSFISDFNDFIQNLFTDDETPFSLADGTRLISLNLDKESKEKIELFLSDYANIIEYHTRKKSSDDLYEFIIFLKEPVEKETETRTLQQKAVDGLMKLRNTTAIVVRNRNTETERVIEYHEDILQNEYPFEYIVYKSEEAKKNDIGGIRIKARGITKELPGSDEKFDGPKIAGLLGGFSDSALRMFFDLESNLWEKDVDGKTILDEEGNPTLVEDKKLEDIIADELGNVFTVGGLHNLIGDLTQLKKELQDLFGEDCIFISKNIPLLGQQKNRATHNIGFPDLIVVDKNGVLHNIDFKTVRIRKSGSKTYSSLQGDQYERPTKFGSQIMGYINLERSYGFKVDPDQYVVRIDTYYEGNTENEPQFAHEEGAPIFEINGEEKYLNEIASTTTTREDIIGGTVDTNTVYYIEPRLHIKGYKDANSNEWSEDSATIMRGRKKELSVYPDLEQKLTYEEQFDRLSTEDQKVLKWMFNAKPIKRKEEREGIQVLPHTDIGGAGKPTELSDTELQFIADMLMYSVSSRITELQNGKASIFYPATLSRKRSPYKGKTRAEIVKMIGLDTLLKTEFDQFFTNEYLIENDDNEKIVAPFPASFAEYEKEGSDIFYFEDEEDYREQEIMYRKKEWIRNHYDQFIRMGASKLIALERFIVPRRVFDKGETTNASKAKIPNMLAGEFDILPSEDLGENEVAVNTVEAYQDGLSTMESWILGTMSISPKSTLSKEIRQIFENLYERDENGNIVEDPYGYGFKVPIDSTKAIQTVLDVCRFCENYEQMESALEILATYPENRWIEDLLDILEREGEKNFGALKTKFFRNFRKDSLIYSVSKIKLDKKTGNRIVEVNVVNTKNALNIMREAVGASFRNGKVGVYTIGNQAFNLINRERRGNLTKRAELVPIGGRNVADVILKDIDKIDTKLHNIYKKSKNLGRNLGVEERKEIAQKSIAEAINNGTVTIQGKEKGIVEAVTDVLHGVGIMVPESVVANACLENLGSGEGKSGTARTLLTQAKAILNTLESKNSQKDFSEWNKATGYKNYNNILSLLSDATQEYIEANVFQDGKTYYSFTNPSRFKYIINNLRNSMEDVNTFNKFIENQYGRYTGWFKTSNEKWLCNWLEKIVNGEAKEALQHKVELSYLGSHYRDLGELGFQLSILHNYFGSANDRSKNKSWRWFAVPTMSNKPTNEFIRMEKYRNNNEIIDLVLLNTFTQEVNRIVDVLYHFTLNTVGTDMMDLPDTNSNKWEEIGMSKEEVKGFQKRIRDHEVTIEDLQKVSNLVSGAKFHFLWYLNDELKTNEDFGKLLTERINILLSPKDKRAGINLADQDNFKESVKGIIAAKMEEIVKSEVKHMEDIGLFEKESVKDKNGNVIERLKYIEEFYIDEDFNLGNPESDIKVQEKDMREKIAAFIWQDIAANINIIQLTGGDLAYFGDAVNYQKRIAMFHSPGTAIMSNPKYDDGFFRSVHISDEHVGEEIYYNSEVALTEYMNANIDSEDAKDDYRKMINVILSGLKKTESTDGQSFNSPSSIRKKLIDMGEWDDTLETAYEEIRKGNFDINHLGVLVNASQKPFVASAVAKYSGSTTMDIRKVPLQEKNSEYLILLAEALARGSGKRSKLTAIFDFMETTHKIGDGRRGIDTAHFESVNKVGKSGIIDIGYFDKNYDAIYDAYVKEDRKEVKDENGVILDRDAAYSPLLTEYILKHVRRYNGEDQSENKYTKVSIETKEDFDSVNEQKFLLEEEKYYNIEYVDTIPIRDHVIQQEVHADLMEDQLYGSQMRILGISDITPSTSFDVNGREVKAEDLIKEFKNLHAQNIYQSYHTLMHKLGLDKLLENDSNDINFGKLDSLDAKDRNRIYKNLEALLQSELSKDTKYDEDTYRACTLKYDDDGNVIDFVVPLMDPIQSRRIQELLNSIIKKSINKQKITGGPVVQVTAYDENLHIRFKDSKGKILKTLDEYAEEIGEEDREEAVKKYKEYLRINQAGIAYFECYMPIPNEELGRLMINPDGSIKSFSEIKKILPKEVFESMMQVIGYRIPTEDKYSMIPIRIVGFMPRAAGQGIMMPKEITYLTGSDFDIDKMYIMMRSFKIEAPEISESKFPNLIEEFSEWYQNMPNGRRITWSDSWKVPIQLVAEMGREIISGDRTFWSMEDILSEVSDDISEEDLRAFMMWYRDKLIAECFSTYKHIEKGENESEEEFDKRVENVSKKDIREGRNNRILDLQWAVLTNKDTLAKILNPGNFNEQKKVGRAISIIKQNIKNPKTGDTYTFEELMRMEVSELDNIRASSNTTVLNTTLPSAKIYFQHQNMQGSQMVGIFANSNVSHAFLSFQKIAINLGDQRFLFEGKMVGDMSVSGGAFIIDPQKGFNGQLISKTIASFLAASVDTAKDPVLADMNINTFTGGVAMLLARLGYDTSSIGLFLSQPIVEKITEHYFKENTGNIYFGEDAIKKIASDIGITQKEISNMQTLQNNNDKVQLTKAEMEKHLADNNDSNYQKEVLKAFYQMYKMASDLQKLTFCTKFNSVSNAVGPTIADTKEDYYRVDDFMTQVKEGKTMFFVPENKKGGKSQYTNPLDVIDNDPILEAFYETTIGASGASETIFGNFFPHYLNGFNSVLNTFKEEHLNGKRLTSKLYNQLLNDYIYFILTYSNEDEEFLPTLPYDKKSKEVLVKDIITNFTWLVNAENRKDNILLDGNIGDVKIRVRESDAFVPIDTLIFNNNKLDSTLQQKIKNAWNDMITYTDPENSEVQRRMRELGSDLFFYSLMRNGFTFSPKTMMTLASVVVRYNAKFDEGFNNYIDGLSNLENLDNHLSSDKIMKERFIDQFIRNHSNNRQLIPNIKENTPHISTITTTKNGDITEFTIKVSKDKLRDLYYIEVSDEDSSPSTYVTLTSKNGNTLNRELFKVVQGRGGSTLVLDEEGNYVITYTKISKLGLSKNFIEYNANDDIETSFFSEVQNLVEEGLEDEEDTEVYNRENTAEKDAEKNFENKIDTLLEAIRNSNGNFVNNKEAKAKLMALVEESKEGSEFRNAWNNYIKNSQDAEAISAIKEAFNSCF